MGKGGPKCLAPAANLNNLLPTGTVLAFQALVPSFSNNGECHPAHRFLTVAIIIGCSLVCFICSFTDSFIDDDGKLYYGFATRTGLYVLNDVDHNDGKGQERKLNDDNYKITAIDFVHAFASLAVFLVFAISSSEVQACLFPESAGPNIQALFMNLPLGAGMVSSLLFMLFPTKRRGIGYGDVTPSKASCTDPKNQSTPVQPNGEKINVSVSPS